MQPDLDTCVADWAIDFPRTVKVFDELQIDYCCGGKSLEYACRQKGLDPQVVLKRLQEVLDDDDCGG